MTLANMEDPPTDPPTDPSKPKTLRATVSKVTKGAGKGIAIGSTGVTGGLGVLYLLWQMGIVQVQVPASKATEDQREVSHGQVHQFIMQRLDRIDQVVVGLATKWNVPVPPEPAPPPAPLPEPKP